MSQNLSRGSKTANHKKSTSPEPRCCQSGNHSWKMSTRGCLGAAGHCIRKEQGKNHAPEPEGKGLCVCFSVLGQLERKTSSSISSRTMKNGFATERY